MVVPVLYVLANLANLVGMKRRLSIIFLSLMTDTVERLFICLPAFQISSFVKCLFKYIAHVKNYLCFMVICRSSTIYLCIDLFSLDTL